MIIDITDIPNIVADLFSSQNSPQYLISKLGNVKINNGFGSYFLNPYDGDYKLISLYVKENKVISVTYYGRTNVTLKKLINSFGKYEKSYSVKDDLYLLRFQTDFLDKKFFIEILSEEKELSAVNNELGRITFKIKDSSS